MITQTGSHSTFPLRSLSKAGSATALVVGLLVLVGWALDIEILKRAFPGLASMKANTAIAFILSGTALWLLQADQVGPRTRPIARVCAFIVALIGALTLIEYQFGWDFGIDQLLFTEALGTSDDSYPGRMSPASALNFILIGCALLLLETNRGILPAQYLLLGAVLISMIALVGYAYGVKSLYSISVYTTMALHTTVTFLVLGFGILAAHPARGLMAVVTSENTGSALARRLLPFAILVPLVGGWLRVKGQDAGLYGTGFGTAVFAVTLVLIFVTVIVRTARSLSLSDEQRKRAEEELERFAKTLEQRVTERTEQLDASRKAALNLVMDTEEARRKAERAEEAVKENEQRLKLALDSAQMGAWELNLTNDTAIRSLKHDQIFGYSSPQSVWGSEIFLSHVVPEDRDLVKKRFEEAFATGHFNLECRILWPDQSRHWIAAQGLVYRNHKGDPVRMMGVVTEITERKRAEEEFRKSEEKYRTLFDSIDVGVCTIEVLFDGNDKPVDYRFLEVNSSFEKQTGIHNAVGRRMREVAPLHEEHWFETYGKVALTGEPTRFENQAAQLHRWYDVYAFRVGQPLERHVAIHFKDITERKRAEGAIETFNEQLQVANKELEAFCYSVSHDLRAPLRSIDGFSQALLEDCAATLAPESASHLQRIRRASQNMAQLIDDLLNLSRITRSELQRVPVNLSALTQGIVDGLRENAPTRCVDVVISPGLVATGDAHLLQVVLENLLGNAWKFTRKRSCARIEFGAADYDGAQAYFVRDDGAGFDRAHAGKLFGAFQRMHTTAEFEGTGIGLATVQRVIHKHSGRVWAESAPEQGATFYFTLSDKKDV